MIGKNPYLISKYGKNPHETCETHENKATKDHIGGVLHDFMSLMRMNYRGGEGGIFFFEVQKILLKLMKLMI